MAYGSVSGVCSKTEADQDGEIKRVHVSVQLISFPSINARVETFL